MCDHEYKRLLVAYEQSIQALLDELSSYSMVGATNKTAARRARVLSSEVESLGKQFRKLSIQYHS